MANRPLRKGSLWSMPSLWALLWRNESTPTINTWKTTNRCINKHINKSTGTTLCLHCCTCSLNAVAVNVQYALCYYSGVLGIMNRNSAILCPENFVALLLYCVVFRYPNCYRKDDPCLTGWKAVLINNLLWHNKMLVLDFTMAILMHFLVSQLYIFFFMFILQVKWTDNSLLVWVTGAGRGL